MIQPTANNLLCRAYERPEKSDGGIWIPEAFRRDESGWLFEVIRTGPGAKTKRGALVPCECKEGDIIHLEGRWYAQELPLDESDEKRYLVCEDHVSHIVWRAE